jgi:hypothetical protein
MNTPPYAYLPGVTPRHTDGIFDGLRDTAIGRPEELALSPAWRVGLEWCAAGYFWEAHELWEVVWMALPLNSPQRRMVQGMIQLANAGLKARMGRVRAVARLKAMARAHFDEAWGGREGEKLMGLHKREAIARLEWIGNSGA